MLQRAFINILSARPDETASFYEKLLGARRSFTSGWFVVLTHPRRPDWEMGILDRSHETVPADLAAAPAGIILTFVVEDVEACHLKAIELGAEIIAQPTDMAYGQRRMLIRDPDGSTVDISALI
ncbi:MAG: VOC family protein [Pseudomonadota bacterium]